jgi:pyridoxamine 5'-phosphate oxidase
MNSVDKELKELRDEVIVDVCDMKEIPENPLELFERWMSDAIRSNANLPNAMHLSTVGEDGRPSGRILLLKGFDERGFVFFTNYESRKGRDLKKNKYASVTFFWYELYRQVRIEGSVDKIPENESDQYFKTRPRESRISALASEQSRILESRKKLEMRIAQLEKKYKGKPIPRPDTWGGYCLYPSCIEFWQGRSHRMHERINYLKDEATGIWSIQLLYP